VKKEKHKRTVERFSKTTPREKVLNQTTTKKKKKKEKKKLTTSFTCAATFRRGSTSLLSLNRSAKPCPFSAATQEQNDSTYFSIVSFGPFIDTNANATKHKQNMVENL
jgi:hypothetical protein